MHLSQQRMYFTPEMTKLGLFTSEKPVKLLDKMFWRFDNQSERDLFFFSYHKHVQLIAKKQFSSNKRYSQEINKQAQFTSVQK